jgi:glycosyltransferase involved in cell wall biosynthesis
MSRRLRVAIVCDARDEGWRSMDLVGDLLVRHLEAAHGDEVAVTALCPPMGTRFRRAPGVTRPWAAFTADRMLHRFWDYPRYLAARRGDFDLFHVVDHSYAQVIHALPGDRTVVTCHDVDAFRSVLEPALVRRSLPFRLMTRRILAGLRRAARVVCDSEATRDDLLRHRVVAAERTAVIPIGVHPGLLAASGGAETDAARLLGPAADDAIDLLHVGSTVPRKRIDVLLRVFAAVRGEHPRARLVRVGPGFTDAQRALARELGVAEAIVELPLVSPAVLGAVYRRAALVLQPSDREGFGIPVIEALACGTPVIASDVPVLREVGGDAADYCPVGDVAAWSARVGAHLRERDAEPARWAHRRDGAARHAARFTWTGYAARTVEVYREVVQGAARERRGEESHVQAE